MTRLVILNFPPPRNRSINLPANRHCWCTRSFSSGGTIRLCYLNSATGGKGPKHAWLPAKKIGLNRSSANLKWADLVTNFLLRSKRKRPSRTRGVAKRKIQNSQSWPIPRDLITILDQSRLDSKFAHRSRRNPSLHERTINFLEQENAK